ncbi:hypothetical protein FCU94_17685 [Vibrio sp. JPW-9-11-11]|nr:hypothetical protein [Vibrio sp. JPW-9-11-11]
MNISPYSNKVLVAWILLCFSKSTIDNLGRNWNHVGRSSAMKYGAKLIQPTISVSLSLLMISLGYKFLFEQLDTKFIR